MRSKANQNPQSYILSAEMVKTLPSVFNSLKEILNTLSEVNYVKIVLFPSNKGFYSKGKNLHSEEATALLSE